MGAELIPITEGQRQVILVPKATTDLPFFYLTKQKARLSQNIQYEGLDLKGRPIRWQVFPNSNPAIGAPGIEAHEAWMRLVKPTFDWHRSSGRPLDVLPLGKLREALRTVGWAEGGWEARRLLKALHQIGAASCVADLWIPTTQKDEAGNQTFQHINATFSKMTIYAIGSKHLTDEELNDGKFDFDFDLDDTLYIQLNPVEVQIQKDQPQRFIDNQYLFSVKPTARRWYELVAPKIFGVVKNNGEYCEVRYSWYVQHHHTLKRYYERYRVVFQMNRLVEDHLRQGYITKIEYRVLKEPGQEIDWLIRYYPGEAAKESIARILSYQYRQRPGEKERITVRTATQKAPAKLEVSEQGTTDPLLSELIKRGITTTQAQKLLSMLESEQQVMDQLEWGDHIVSQGAIKNPPGLYVTFIKENLIPPDSFETSSKRRLKEQARQAASASEQDEEALRVAYSEYRNREIDEYIAENPGDYERFYLEKRQQSETKFNGFSEWKPELAGKFITTLARAEVAKRIPFNTLETFRTLRPAPSVPPATWQPLILLALPAPGQGSQTQEDTATVLLLPPHPTHQTDQPPAPDIPYIVV
jgi:hypothetical protein